MVFNMIYGGGGGAGGGDGSISFVYDVIRSDSFLPADAPEGQVVIITATPFNKVTFWYNEPTDPAEGDVWIHTVDNGGYTLLGGSSRPVIISPGATVQYIGGAWEYRDAYIGVGGEWKMFSTLSPLSSLSWSQISAISRSGEDMGKFFAVGDQKDIMIDGVTYPVQIIGMHHDDLADVTCKVGLTFDMVDLFTSTRGMNSSNTNSGGWASCAMRTYLSDTMLPLLPADLQAAIRPVTKITGNSPTVDSLWLLSIPETGLTYQYASSQSGTAYARFTAAADRIKKRNGTATIWWTRSPHTNSSSAFCGVTATGTATSYSASTSYGVCFGFCV